MFRIRMAHRTTSLDPHVNGGLSLLPQEVWDHIIDDLHNDRGTIAVKACALACRAWLRTARKLLWCQLSLISASHVRLLLHRHPNVAGMVRELSVFVEIREVSSLSAFANLRKLDLYFSEHEEQDPVQSISQELRFPSITNLDVHTLYHFMSATALERLLILSVGDGPDLWGLRVFQAESLPQTSPISLPHLRKLTVKADHLVMSLPAILRSAGASLELVELRIPPAVLSNILPDMLDFSQNQNLKRLEITGCLDPYCSGWGDCLAPTISQLNARHDSLIDLHLYITSTPASFNILANLPPIRVGHVKNPGSFSAGSEHYSSDAAHQARRYVAGHLLRRFPDLRTYPTRVRFASHLDLCGGALLNEGLEQRRIIKGLWSVPMFDV
ncbi:uncharacterized protein B0H18DRAFT_974402 [Fomitopsis serialis]|uniref:uncharacterized protein n=1 Tax=Fomitopsis serialis TaxID=139415 RepID=UPI002007E887|nr:uncharacterized protein B0H18DRAFT_974402 [Neoantrodia serialis]KAH9936559.1 hypothetical protein B0H18DRAFT_974402 [Neoantrodia serialis]